MHAQCLDKKPHRWPFHLFFSPVPEGSSPYSVEDFSLGLKSQSDLEKFNVGHPAKRFENDFGKLFPSLRKSREDLLGSGVELSEAQKMQVNDVSECVISAAKNPEFGQKLHAVLLGNGTPGPPDLFPDLNHHDILGMKILETIHLVSGEEVVGRAQNYSDALFSNNEQLLISPNGEQSFNGARIDSMDKHPSEGFTEKIPIWGCNTFNMRYLSSHDTTNEVYVHANSVAEAKNHQNYAPLSIVSANQPGVATRNLYEELPKVFVGDGELFVKDKVGGILDNVRKENRCTVRLVETVSGNSPILCSAQDERIDPVLGEVADWEIPWEDLLIGE